MAVVRQLLSASMFKSQTTKNKLFELAASDAWLNTKLRPIYVESVCYGQLQIPHFADYGADASL